MLNEEQFDAVRAGDWFCDCHTNGRGNTAYAYFWQRELSAKEALPALRGALAAARAELERNGPAPDGSDDWIACADRKPGTEDQDWTGCVWAVRLDPDGTVAGPQVEDIRDFHRGDYWTHWKRTALMACPAAPKGVTP